VEEQAMHCHPLRKALRKPSGKPLLSAKMSNPLPFLVQNRTQIVKAVDEWKNEQSAAIHRAKRRANRSESH